MESNRRIQREPIPRLYPALVWVQCREKRCLACQAATGKWINFYTGKLATHSADAAGQKIVRKRRVTLTREFSE